MKPINPQHMQAGIAFPHQRWTQSINKVLNGGVTLGNPVTKNSAGVYNTFQQDTSDGILLRIGATGGSESYNWPSSGPLVIHHGLGRQPVGFKIVDKDKTVDIWRTATPDNIQITLQPSDHTANVTLYIF